MSSEQPQLFPHPFKGSVAHESNIWDLRDTEPWLDPCRTLVELQMTALSATLRDKPEWWRKSLDPNIRARWEAEALAQGLTKQQVDYVLEELDGYRALRDEGTGIEVSCCDRVWQSDSLVPSDARDALKTAVKVLEDVPDDLKDWHPRSNGLVLDLVQPSLYPLVYGRSLRKTQFSSRREAVLAALTAWYPDEQSLLLPVSHPSAMPSGDVLRKLPPQDWDKNALCSWLFTSDPDDVDDTEWVSIIDAALDFVDDGRFSCLKPAIRFRNGLLPLQGPPESFVTSARFAWLPTDFHVDSFAEVHAQGYINNVHFSQPELVSVLESVLAAFIPMFDRVLTDILLENKIPLKVHVKYKVSAHPPEPPRGQEGDDDAYWLADDDSEYWRKYQHWWDNERGIVPPLPLEHCVKVEERKTYYSLRGRDIQVIVKLANIILTPVTPEYPGGSWHVEGMMNEQIVASGIYYYDEENISESRLAFRAGVLEPSRGSYEQNDNRGCRQVYGIGSDDHLVQILGSVHTKAGRCIAFPNILQHRVSPFSLADPTRPGHRKILALFLVDPTKKIPSTSTVGFQRRDWVYDALRSCTLLAALPDELISMIVDMNTETITHDEALRFREELMDERTQATKKQEDTDDSNYSGDQPFFGGTFNMCEH